MSKYIIFITDDFGMTNSINHGIVKVMTTGVVTASNFMVPTPWFLESLTLAETYDLPVGIHLNITCEWENYRWRPMSTGKTIRDSDGTFFRSYRELMAHATHSEIYNEYKVQVEYLLSKKWEITHIDSHMLPPVFHCDSAEIEVAGIIEQIAKEYNLLYLYGCEDNKSRYFDTYFEKSGNSEENLYQHLASLTDGFHLVVTHSALESREQQSLTPENSIPYPWALEYRKADLAILTSDRLKNYLINENFKTITVPQLLELKNIT